VQVDAFPGETFKGRIARVSPVLDPATRTAPIEIEIPNPDFRLKPGMYARVGITTDVKKDALVVPVNAVIDLGGRRGVFQPQNETAIFRSVQVGSEQRDVIEILGGIVEGDMVITTGAAALRDGDRILLPGRQGGGRGRRGDAAAGQPAGEGAAPGGAPQAGSPSDATRQGGAGREGGSTRRDGSGGAQGGREFSGSGRRPGGDGQRNGREGRRPGGDGSTRGGQRPSNPSSQE
jgi:hypothetical protein